MNKVWAITGAFLLAILLLFRYALAQGGKNLRDLLAAPSFFDEIALPLLFLLILWCAVIALRYAIDAVKNHILPKK